MSVQSCQEDSVILYGLNRFYLGIHVRIQAYMHEITVNKTREHEFEGEWEEICGRVWMGKREGRDVEIIL